MHSVDGSFKKKRESRLLAKKRQARWRRILLLLTALVIVPAVFGAGYWYYKYTQNEGAGGQAGDEIAEVIVPSFAPTIIDLPGDPIRIELGAGGGASNIRALTLPPTLASLGVSGQVSMLSEKIIESGQRLVTTIPSTQQDFAFFQSQRNAGGPADDAAPLATPLPDSAGVIQNAAPPDPPLSEPSGTAPANGPAPTGVGSQSDQGGRVDSSGPSERTVVENNVSTINLIPEINRSPSFEDVFVHVVSAAEPSQFFSENGIDILHARRAAEALKSAFQIQAIDPGTIVAMRQLKVSAAGGERKLVQLALYQPEQFLAALALSDTDGYETSADPWSDRDLFEHAKDAKEAPASQFRLLDGIYSAGVRGGVPPSVVGEAIMYLSRNYDLSDLAGNEDRITLVYSNTPREGGESPGRILYASVEQPKRQIHCFVFKAAGAKDFNCLDEHDQSATIETVNDMVTPVSGGVMGSRFGMRMHPILKIMRPHDGVDWAAPVGTPVRAAFAGTILDASGGGDYGNVVKISHPDGRETRYAHLSAFAKDIKAGVAVAAGDLIGFVGTTGLSTGPHLHFELRLAGRAIDPIAAETVSRSAEPESIAVIVSKIIHIESGGNPNARNPTSTAEGLGQFIDSTWLRVMQSHRPDLASAHSREELLEMKFDPALSRELLTAFTRDNKAYLESVGDPVSPGSLYLAHFLGAGGAHLALSRADNTSLETVFSSSVIQANVSIMAGKTVGELKNWSARKMGGQVAVAEAPVIKSKTVDEASPAFTLYRKTLLALAGET